MRSNNIVIKEVTSDEDIYEFPYIVMNEANYSIIAGFDCREDAEFFIEAFFGE